MSDPWGTADCAPSDRLAAVQQRIQQVAAVGVEIVNQLVAPANGALKKLNGARTRITKQLLSPAAEEMAQLENAAQQIADNSALQYQAPAAQAVEVVVDNRGRDGVQERHDTDQPDLLIIADADQEWHQKLRAWYAGQLDSVLLSATIMDAIAFRESESQRLMRERSHEYATFARDYEYGE